MTDLAVVAACALAVTFGVSSASKLRDWPSFLQAVDGFGVPARVSTPVAVALTGLEAASAVALLAPGIWAIAGAVTAAVLLVAFTAGIAVNLARGRHPACNCFGRASSKPLSWRSVVRNLALLALTVPVLLAGADDLPGLLGWLDDRSAAQAALLAGALVAATVAVSSWLLGRQVVGEVQGVRRDLRAGGGSVVAASTAPGFTLPSLDGISRSLAELLAPGRPVLLFFMSPSCTPCRALAPDVQAWSRASAGALTMAVISDGTVDSNREEFGDDVLVLLQQGREVQDLYDIDGTPALVLLGPDGSRIFDPAYGADEVRSLVADLAPEELPPPRVHQVEPRPLGVGDPLPDAEVRDLDGGPVMLPRDLPDEAILLFWDTTCGFANAIKEDVLAWEASRPEGDAELIVLNRGDRADIRNVGFRARVLQDGAYRVGNAIQSPGTPSAVTVTSGRLSSEVAAGGPDVLALLKATPTEDPDETRH